jgi:hypothetical protein
MKTIKKAQNGVTKKPAVKVVEKKTTITAKPKSVSQKLGDITLRDLKNSGEDALQLATLGGYGKIKKAFGGEYKHKKIGEKKNGGPVKAKKGATIKKAQNGYTGEPGLLERTGPMRKTKVKERSDDGNYVKKTVTRTRKGATTTSSKTRRTLQGVMNGAPSVGSMKSGGTMKKCKGGC